VSVLALLLLSASDCQHKAKGQYKGRLEIAGICMHYTISLLEGKIDSSLLERTWVDENTGKSYSNAFTLGDPCSFPKDLKAGDEFYFNIDTSTAPRPCMVCEAFYPTPAKALRIQVTGK
jgi:hypothetical protein